MSDPRPAPTPPAPAPRRPRSGARRWLFRLVALAGVLGAVLVGGELTLRVTGFKVHAERTFRPAPYRADPDVGWSFKPDYEGVFESFLDEYPVHVNHLGFRGHELAATPPKHRVVVVGDSNAFGLGVSDADCLPAQLEKRLRATDATAEVVNTGVPAWNTEQELILLEKRGLALKPSAVVLQWNTNDLDDDWRTLTVTEEGDLIRQGDVQLWKKLSKKRGSIWARSEFLAFLNVKYRIAKHRWITQRDRAETFDPDEAANQSYDKNLAFVRRIRDLTRSAGARFLFLLAPLRIEVERGVTGRYRDKVAAFCKAEKIELVDELDGLRADWNANKQDLFVERDSGHLNARGNAVVSEVVGRWYLSP